MRTFVLDTETCGSSPADAPIEIALLEPPKTNYQYRLRPEFPISPGATTVHGITNAAAAKWPEPGDQLANFYRELAKPLEHTDSVLMGYNIYFDIDIVNDALQRHELPAIKFAHVVDLMTIAQRVLPPAAVGDYRLDTVYFVLHGADEHALKTLQTARTTHSALADVALTWSVCEKLMERMRSGEFGGRPITTIDDLVTYYETPVLLSSFPLGKHKGKPFVEVLRTEPGFITWLMKQTWLREPRHRDLVHTLNVKGKPFGISYPVTK